MSKDQKHQNDATNTKVSVFTQTDDESTINTSKQSSSPKSEGSNKDKIVLKNNAHQKAQEYLAKIDQKVEQLEESEQIDDQNKAKEQNDIVLEILDFVDRSKYSPHVLKTTIDKYIKDADNLVIFLENFYYSFALNKEKQELDFKNGLKYAYDNAQENNCTETIKLLGELYSEYHLEELE